MRLHSRILTRRTVENHFEFYNYRGIWCAAVTYIDSTGVHAIKEIYHAYKARKIQVVFYALFFDAQLFSTVRLVDSNWPTVLWVAKAYCKLERADGALQPKSMSYGDSSPRGNPWPVRPFMVFCQSSRCCSSLPFALAGWSRFRREKRPTIFEESQSWATESTRPRRQPHFLETWSLMVRVGEFITNSAWRWRHVVVYKAHNPSCISIAKFEHHFSRYWRIDNYTGFQWHSLASFRYVECMFILLDHSKFQQESIQHTLSLLHIILVSYLRKGTRYNWKFHLMAVECLWKRIYLLSKGLVEVFAINVYTTRSWHSLKFMQILRVIPSRPSRYLKSVVFDDVFLFVTYFWTCAPCD